MFRRREVQTDQVAWIHKTSMEPRAKACSRAQGSRHVSQVVSGTNAWLTCDAAKQGGILDATLTTTQHKDPSLSTARYAIARGAIRAIASAESALHL